MAAKPPRRFLRFSLRAMLLVMIVVGASLGWFGRKFVVARQQRLAVGALREMGCGVDFATDTAANRSSPMIEWLGKWLGEDLSSQAISVHWSSTEITDAGYSYLRGLPYLQNLILFGTHVNDTGLAHLEPLSQLKHLDLDGSEVTDAGLSHVRALRQLTYLNLHKTRVSDAGLLNLVGLSELVRLNLTATQVTDAGAKQLRQALPALEIIR
jgi:hypothetical protein